MPVSYSVTVGSARGGIVYIPSQADPVGVTDVATYAYSGARAVADPVGLTDVLVGSVGVFADNGNGTWTAPVTDNGNGTWTSASPTDNGNGTWTG